MVSGSIPSSELIEGREDGEPASPSQDDLREKSGAERSSRAASAGVAALDDPDGIWIRQAPIQITLYWGIHASCLLALWTGATITDLALFATTYFVRIFAITGAYHRYFSHRTYRTSRLLQFILAFLGTSAVQKGPLWWAANHRVHHRKTDREGDPHSPREGFYYSHQGWIFDPEWSETRMDEIRDMSRFPELVWLNRWHVVAPICLGVLCFAIGGWTGLLWGFAISTTLLWHTTYSINSLAHVWGTRRYDTDDDSRNNFLLALLTLGEGWHNNHHFHQSSVRQGFYWWEIDITYYILRAMGALGLIWDLKQPPDRAYETAAGVSPPEPGKALES